LLGAGCSAVAEGNFARTEPFERLPPARLVQVHVAADAETLRRRLRTRAGRHAVHYDALVADEIADRAARGEWGPLELDAPLVQVDATSPADPAGVASRVAFFLR
jgi:hypothetical protein